MPEQRSPHQQRVEQFMRLAKQMCPERICVPPQKVRELRAKLILEEALETIDALGFGVHVDTREGMDGDSLIDVTPNYQEDGNPAKVDLALVMDGCADVSVVTIGTLTACGIPDQPLLELVDENNLAKFGPGHTVREDGKLVKPPNHEPPDFKGLLWELNPANVH